MKKHFLIAAGLVFLAVVGTIGQLQVKASTAAEYTLANIQAATVVDEEELTCPSPYDVPYAYLKVTTKVVDVVCDKDCTLSFSGFTLTGDYKKGVTYSCVLVIKTCELYSKKEMRRSCCPYDQQGAYLLEPEKN